MSLSRRKYLTYIALGSLALPTFAGAATSDWPNKPIKFIVPSAPGGGADMLARLYVPHLMKDLGQPVVMDYRPGAGGLLAAKTAKTSAADGYTLLLTNSSILGANQFLYKDLPYDPVHDFDHIALLAGSGSVAIVPKNAPFKTIPELVQHAKDKPGQTFFGYYASSSQIPPETLKARANIDIRGVAYKNITQITTDLISGQISFAFLDYASALGALNTGELVPIAVTSKVAHPLWPGVPALSSFYPGMDFDGWYGLSAPRGIPRDAIEKIARSVANTQADPAFQTQLEKLGYLVVRKSTDEYVEVVNNEKSKWARQIQAARISLD